MGSVFDQLGDRLLPGSSLRNEAASYLHTIHGNAQVEIMVEGKKVDVVCSVRTFGKVTDLYVEVKDYEANLGRSEVAHIHSDYSAMVGQGRSAQLLVVTRRGLAPAAQAFVDSQPAMFHQTIWELEDEVLGLIPYVQAQLEAFDSEGLRDYYIPARARRAAYDGDQKRSLESVDEPLFEVVQAWLDEENAPPLAILGGYGAGKSSFAKRVLSEQAAKALEDPIARRPVLIKLGNITRSTGLDSLLGSLFTSEYEVRGYSFRRFKELNAKGRLLIILDGFDEMKHAMTWTEFRNEIQELNALNAGNARVLLLGRPSAFTSDDEHLEVLRGRTRVAGMTRRLADWPEFREYELEPFTRAERTTFIERFLLGAEARRTGQSISDANSDTVKARAAEVNALADQEDEVFGKPVHAKILVELAIDPDFDLTSFATNVTRWTLYAEFFSMLARRETGKAARSPIEAQYRLEFLRRVALWLWEDKDGATSFKASDLPGHVLEGLPDGDTDTLDDKRREYLAGAFLERKAGDTFFFPHRSFAEFLVAEQLALNPPTEQQHERYADLSRGGVEAFLSAAPIELGVTRWAETLTKNSGHLPASYLLLLPTPAGGYFETLAEIVPDNSAWKPILRMFGTPPEDVDGRRAIMGEALLRSPVEAIALLLSGIGRYWVLMSDDDKPGSGQNELAKLFDVVAAGLITRVMSSVREKDVMSRLTIDERHSSILEMAQSAIVVEGDADSRAIQFSWNMLASCAAGIADRSGPSLASASPLDFGDIPDKRIPYITVRNLMPQKISNAFHQFVLKRGSLKTISVVVQTERRRSQ